MSRSESENSAPNSTSARSIGLTRYAPLALGLSLSTAGCGTFTNLVDRCHPSADACCHPQPAGSAPIVAGAASVPVAPLQSIEAAPIVQEPVRHAELPEPHSEERRGWLGRCFDKFRRRPADR